MKSIQMNKGIRPLKHLGQHFLKDESVCERIVTALNPKLCGYDQLLEIGPGTGVLTKYLLKVEVARFYAIELDTRSVEYLKVNYPELGERLINSDFLSMDIGFLDGKQFGIAGNFPYNISSQILFKVLDNWQLIPELIGMFQDEVALRICSAPGNKTYGILSVLLQAYYTTEYLFQVPPHVFIPPPKVNSGVIRLRRKPDPGPGCDPVFFKKIVKAGFNQRRKTLRNSLKTILGGTSTNFPYSDKRPEQLDFNQFAEIVNCVSKHDAS